MPRKPKKAMHKTVTIQFDLNDATQKTLYDWIKLQGNVSQVAFLGLYQLHQQYGDGNLYLAMAQHPFTFGKLPDTPTQSSEQTTEPKVDIKDKLDEATRPVQSENSQPTQVASSQNPDEVNDSPFGGASTGFGSNNDTPSDGGDWRKQI